MTKSKKMFALALFVSFIGFTTACGSEEPTREVVDPPKAEVVLPTQDKTPPEITIEALEELMETDQATLVFSFSEPCKGEITIRESSSGGLVEWGDIETQLSRSSFAWMLDNLTPDTGYMIVVEAWDVSFNRSMKFGGFRTKAIPPPATLQPKVDLSYGWLTSRGAILFMMIEGAPENAVCQVQTGSGTGSFYNWDRPFVCGSGTYTNPMYNYLGERVTVRARVVYKYGPLEVVSNVISFTTGEPEMSLTLVEAAPGGFSLQWQSTKEYYSVHTSCYSGSDWAGYTDSTTELVGMASFIGLESGREYTCYASGTLWTPDGFYVTEGSERIYVTVP